MKYELRHHSFKPTLGGKSVLSNKTINDLGESALYYVGTFSEYNPLYLGSNSLLYIRKNWTTDGSMQHPINLNGLKFKGGINSSGSGICTHGGFQLTKQDLLRIANAMDETDTFVLSEIIQKTEEGIIMFKYGILKVVGS